MPHLTPPSAAIKTLGCKLNQFESEQIRAELARLGCRFVPFESPADIYVINSCTVTARTDRDCRRLIRHAKRLNPASFVAVTGCYAQVFPEALQRLPEADLVVGNADKATLAERIRDRLADALRWPVASDPQASDACYAGSGPPVEQFSDHTRAFVKVQEGCDAACTYCIVPRARGPSRSVPPQQVEGQVARLISAGHAEVVLIGIHLGKYGADLPDAPDLAGLVARLCDLPGLGRIRLSSLEPREVSERLVELVTRHPRVCRHLHIPLQSGCQAVLQRMNRPYEPGFYADLIRRIRRAGPAVCLGADVMVGFPGETEAEFEATRRFVADLPLSYLHVFTYSPRPGTPAAQMPDQVPPEVKLARNHLLRDLSVVKRSALARSMVAATLEVIFERPVPGSEGLLDGLSSNYLRVHAAGAAERLGTLNRVQITEAVGETLLGRIVDE